MKSEAASMCSSLRRRGRLWRGHRKALTRPEWVQSALASSPGTPLGDVSGVEGKVRLEKNVFLI